MPVALPPPLPPQPGAVFTQTQRSSHAALQFQQYRVHLLGAPLLDAGAAAAAMQQADTLSNAVRRLASACYAAGYPTAQLRYMLDGEDLYVLVVTGHLADARIAPPLTPYFRGLLRDQPLTDDALEPRRMLASVHAERAGMQAQMQFHPRGDDYLLEVTATPPVSSDSAVIAAISNPGNRYVGRYFSDLGLRHDRASGDEVFLNWRHGLVGLDDDSRASADDEGLVSYSRVTPLGVFGAVAQHLDYRLGESAEGIDGRLQQAALTWLTPLFADFHQRWTANLRLDYTRQTREQAGYAEAREQYTSFEAGSVYSRELAGWQVDAGLQLRQGLGGAIDGAAQPDYLALRPKLRLQRGIEDWDFGFELRGQWSDDTLPQQSQWLLGGQDHLSAWLPGVTVGDSGLVAEAEGGYALGSWGPFALRAKLFAEYGNSRAREGDAATVQLSDAGAGLKLAYGKALELETSYALPLDAKGIARKQREDAEAGLLFRAAWTF